MKKTYNLLKQFNFIKFITLITIISVSVQYTEYVTWMSSVNAAELETPKTNTEAIDTDSKATLSNTSLITTDSKPTEDNPNLTDGELNIVIFGDSIWDFNREDDGVAGYLESFLQFYFPEEPINIYNMAVGGTCAAAIDSPKELDRWNSRGLSGMLYTVQGLIEPERLYADTNMLNVLPDLDLEKADYFILSYGLNDYFFDIPIDSEDPLDQYTYTGSLKYAVTTLREINPSAEFLIISPTWCQFYDGPNVTATCLSTDRYGGLSGRTLDKYVTAAEIAANDMNTGFLNAFADFNLGAESQPDYTLDGVHFNKAGRFKYAFYVAAYLSFNYQQQLLNE